MAILIHDRTKDGVYEWPTNPSTSIIEFSSVKALLFDWHHRLGHPSDPIHCNDCFCNKSHKLPFSQSTIVSSAPLHIIFFDVWTSSIQSTDNFKYYFVFVDHFTHYIWLYPLKRKSDVSLIFPHFKSLVQNFFKRKIITLYSNNGGEYMDMFTFLATHGISHHTSPSYTPEHNGFSEHRRCHKIETSLALLSLASLPISSWSYAFLTTPYLNNCLPTPTL